MMPILRRTVDLGILPAIVAGLLMSTNAVVASDAAKEIPDEATLDVGRDIFLNTEPACGICHVLADAETEGTIAPSLDRLRPSVSDVRLALTEGPGAMPDYTEVLSPEEIDAVAAYVAHVAGED